MSDSGINEDPWTASYGVPEAFPSPAAIEFHSHTLQDFSSFLGSSSPQQWVDFSLLQLYQSQLQLEELAFWEQTDMDSPQRQLSFDEIQLQPTLQQREFNEPPLQQTNVEAPRQHSQLSPLWLRFDEELQLQVLNKLEANMEAPQRQHIQPSQKQLSVHEPQLKLHLNFNRHEIPPPRSDITLNTGMENKIVWNAMSDINCELQACSPPGADIHWPYGEMDKPLFDIPFFSGKFDSSSLLITERWING
ncbi:hypothetical protein Ddye_013789 [Dipteronia dyeriana]|uniref:Uncharacterized protein n=1 Tax=Dipteronia dyeriana TaxID=168575 RepID=A0AAD9X7A3_9ROSI|nr:hypothetical protein Ddye_013789 [Dipteronia dyeriana]